MVKYLLSAFLEGPHIVILDTPTTIKSAWKKLLGLSLASHALEENEED